MSCLNNQTCCEKAINNIIDEKKDHIKDASILFYSQLVPEAEFLGRLQRNFIPSKVLIISKEFEKAWDEVIEQVITYKKRVVTRSISLPIIIRDIEYFIKNEKENHDLLKRNLSVKLKMIEEEKQNDMLDKINEYDILFSTYMDNMESKKKAVIEAEDYMPLVVDEINMNIEWFKKQRKQAEQRFKEKIDCMVSDLIHSSIVKTYKAGKNITLTILKLEEKLRQKRIELGGAEDKDLEQVSDEILKLQQDRCSLDYQAVALVDLEKTFQNLIKEQNEIFDIMRKLEDEFDRKVEEIMKDHCLTENDKHLKVKELKCKHEDELNELQEREECIHCKIEKIRHEILSRHEGFDIAVLEKIGMEDIEAPCEGLRPGDPNFTLYRFDQYGRYFINENGLKIYKTDTSSKAYIMDENRNMLEIRMDGSQVLFISDSDYLKYHVGEALKKGLAQVFLYQPMDPIFYLANYLIKYRKNMIAEEERKRDLDDLLLREDRKC